MKNNHKNFNLLLSSETYTQEELRLHPILPWYRTMITTKLTSHNFSRAEPVLSQSLSWDTTHSRSLNVNTMHLYQFEHSRKSSQHLLSTTSRFSPNGIVTESPGRPVRRKGPVTKSGSLTRFRKLLWQLHHPAPGRLPQYHIPLIQ